jgi:aspartyl-tRNA(Asn)/glutamyl-tRNA(Gln) amidotransferase subunit C
VLDYAARLDELDLDDVPPTAHAVTQQNVMGEDVAEPSLPREDALRNAPDRQDHQFRIQAVLDDA